MKKSLITTLVAAPLLSLSSMAFAAQPAAAEPVLLSASQMDGVTAGALIDFGQFNVSPIVAVQLNLFSDYATNALNIVSGNVGFARQ